MFNPVLLHWQRTLEDKVTEPVKEKKRQVTEVTFTHCNETDIWKTWHNEAIESVWTAQLTLIRYFQTGLDWRDIPSYFYPSFITHNFDSCSRDSWLIIVSFIALLLLLSFILFNKLFSDFNLINPLWLVTAEWFNSVNYMTVHVTRHFKPAQVWLFNKDSVIFAITRFIILKS